MIAKNVTRMILGAFMIYLNREKSGGEGLFLRDGAKLVYTGLDIHTEPPKAEPLAAELERLGGIFLLRQGQEPALSLYGVPWLEVFASDGGGGYFAAVNGLDQGPVCWLPPDRPPRWAANSLGQLLQMAAGGPDWPNVPWPRLPEDPEGRAALAAALPSEVAGTEKTAQLPRVFSSREAAEKEFPIQDIWTLLRQKREPRFQVWPMQSPQDREGKAFVHYTAWREAYTGLMDERILAQNTLERCRRMAERYPENTLVVLDRERGDTVAGFACYGQRARDFFSVQDASEICALYVLRAYQGLGLGRRLMESCLALLRRPNIALLVLKGNQNAVGFYEHMGFRLTGHRRSESIGGAEITELEMVLKRPGGR